VIDYIVRWFWTATHSCDDQNTMQILVMSAGEMGLKEFRCSGSFATIRFVMSVRLSVSQSVRPHGKTRLPLDRFAWNLMYFSKICSGNSNLLKSVRIIGTLHGAGYTFFIIRRSVLLRMRNILEKIIQKVKIHILFAVTFYFENRAV